MGYFAKEGYAWIFGALFLTIAAYMITPAHQYGIKFSFIFLCIPMIGITIFMIFFFRNPNRSPDDGYDPQKSILSPADGSICAIEEEEGNLAFYIECT